MKDIIDKSKVLIFDLDGTLYEDTDHFDYYAKLLATDLPKNEQRHFLKEYEAMKTGNHIVAIGKGYDVRRDSILTIDPMTLEITEVHDWSGQAWTMEKVHNTYDGPVAFDFENTIAIGDGWWLPFVTAKHFGVKDTHSRYNQTKEYMVTDQFQLTKTPGLKEGLLQLKSDKQLVLMTNSDSEDVGRLLKELELDTIFEHIIPSAYKPVKTVETFHDIMRRYGVKPHETVSIGDNFINEIAPALKVGMHGVYINPHQSEIAHENLAIVPTLQNAL